MVCFQDLMAEKRKSRRDVPPARIRFRMCQYSVKGEARRAGQPVPAKNQEAKYPPLM